MKIYSTIFFLLIIFCVYVQQKTIQSYQKDWNSWKVRLKESQVVARAHNFHFSRFEDSDLIQTMTGHELTSLKSGLLKGTGDIVIKDFSSLRSPWTLKTQSIHAIPSEAKSTAFFPREFQKLLSDDDCVFEFEKHYGYFRDLTVDLKEQTAQSKKRFLITGPLGELKGQGFWFNGDDIKIFNDVQGVVRKIK